MIKKEEKKNHPGHRQLIASSKGDVSLAFDARDFFSEFGNLVTFLQEIAVDPEAVVEFEGGSGFTEGVGGGRAGGELSVDLEGDHLRASVQEMGLAHLRKPYLCIDTRIDFVQIAPIPTRVQCQACRRVVSRCPFFLLAVLLR